MKFPNDPLHPILFHDQWITERLKKDESLKEYPTIPEFYANQEIFITGGSGFIGKVLIEKLLRSCPDIKTIYILMRPKKELTPAERLKLICDEILFDLLRQINPNFMNKLVAIEGDAIELGIGLSENDRELMKNVSVIFHSAASVRFDDSLKYAVLLNTRGTREIMKFAETLENIKVVMHVSTTYSNVNRSTVKEEIYPPIADWKETIKICENADSDQLNYLTQRFMGFMPNTYVFSKNLAEHVSHEYRDKLPLVIFRPSIVVNAFEEPYGGYVDNFNGPMGILLASHIGISKTMYCDEQNVMDLTPVDVCVKTMIIAAWKRGNEPQSSELPIINAASANQIRTTLKQLLDIGIHGCCDEFPMGDLTVTVPSGGVTLCCTWNLLKCFFLQLLPAMLIDKALKIQGKRPKLMKIQRKIFEANKALTYFVTHNWDFQNENFLKLSSFLRAEDLRAFDYRNYFKTSPILNARYILYGYRKYLIKLKDKDLAKDRRQLDKLKFITKIFKFFLYAVVTFVIYKSLDVKFIAHYCTKAIE